MTAPLTKTRIKKQKMLKEIITKSADLLSFPKGSLDHMDYRKLSKILKHLNELLERAKPI